MLDVLNHFILASQSFSLLWQPDTGELTYLPSKRLAIIACSLDDMFELLINHKHAPIHSFRPEDGHGGVWLASKSTRWSITRKVTELCVGLLTKQHR